MGVGVGRGEGSSTTKNGSTTHSKFDLAGIRAHGSTFHVTETPALTRQVHSHFSRLHLLKRHTTDGGKELRRRK